MSTRTIGRPMEVLLVEDSLLDARLTINALKKGSLQHRLTLILDGQEAMEFLLQQGRFALAPRPDLILLDLLLPKMNGLEVLAEVKRHPDLKDIPIVILTAADDADIRDQVESYQVEHFIRKPVNFDGFLRVVKELKHHWHHDLILPWTE
jgi:two-component system, chemotaxis family, response regulator Rcp1